MRILISIVLFSASSIAGASSFDAHFEDATLRIDYYRSGDAEAESVTFDRALRQGIWAGPKTQTLDPFDYGRSIVRVFDTKTGEELFSKGLDSYFGEYRTTGPAHEGQSRTYHESVLLPFPKHAIRVTIDIRGSESGPLVGWKIDPEDIAIASEKPASALVFNHHVPALPQNCLDIAFLGEGYTSRDVGIFREDLERCADLMLEH